MVESSQNTINELLSFWFSDAVKKLWFNSTPEFDNELKQNYLPLLEAAERGELQHWEQTPQGCVALAIVFDQLPLNMFRGQSRSYATESHALGVAQRAIDKDFDSQLSNEQKVFLYMPFMHSENLDHQEKSVGLFDEAGLVDNLKYAKHHRAIIQRFGRFPHRNRILGRESTAEEVHYLNSKEAFLG